MIAKARKAILDIKKVEFLDNFFRFGVKPYTVLSIVAGAISFGYSMRMLKKSRIYGFCAKRLLPG